MTLGKKVCLEIVWEKGAVFQSKQGCVLFQILKRKKQADKKDATTNYILFLFASLALLGAFVMGPEQTDVF